jgi:hypothetical protein
MMKGNSCSGVAAAAPENAMVPIASALKVAARREFSLNASRLNLGRPCLIALARPFGASLDQSLAGEGFRMFASNPQNGFVGAENCFVAVSRQNSLSGGLPPARRF